MEQQFKAMAQKSKIAVVTGSNKGIGFEIVKQLAKNGITTVLTARDESRGAQAVESLKSQGLDVKFHQLDVSDPASVQRTAHWLQQSFRHIDILVNNAGIASLDFLAKKDDRSLDKRIKEAQAVLETNYYGAKRMTEACIPLIKPGGRIINVSSRVGQFDSEYFKLNEFQRRSFSDVANLSEQVIESCLKEFMKAVGRGRLEEEGYHALAGDYSMSKFALNAYTRLMAPRLQEKGIFINAMCPGYTSTDINKRTGPRSVEEGADTAVWLAVWNESDEYPSGKFFAERNEIHF